MARLKITRGGGGEGGGRWGGRAEGGDDNDTASHSAPATPSPKISYNDICFQYDVPGARSPITFARKTISSNCYVNVPNPLLDPVCAANEARLKKFDEQTFFVQPQCIQVLSICCNFSEARTLVAVSLGYHHAVSAKVCTLCTLQKCTNKITLSSILAFGPFGS